MRRPALRNLTGKGAADKRADHRSNAVRHPDNAREHGSLLGLCNEGYDGISTGPDSRSAEPSDGTADDQSLRARRYAADKATELKDKDGEKEGDL